MTPMSDQPTGPAGSPAAFPDTRFSVVVATGSHDVTLRDDAWAALIRAYWRPVYKYIRVRWQADAEDAKDLTQGFFTHALDTGVLERFDPGRARFRTWLRVCVNGFVANERKAMTRKKRGGDYRMLPLDFDGAERELAQAGVVDNVDPDAFFRRESVRALFSIAVDELRERLEHAGKRIHFTVFERYDLADPDTGERPTYRQLATELDLPVTQVTNFLAFARRAFRDIVLDRLREISGSRIEFRLEAIELLGVDPSDVDS